MSNRSPNPDDRTQYGGQAVVEGVMMRSPRYFAIACRRRSDQEIVVCLEPVGTVLPAWLKWLNVPFLRGTAALVDAMAMGVRALTYSGNLQMEDEIRIARAATKPGSVATLGPLSLVMADETSGPPKTANRSEPSSATVSLPFREGLGVGSARPEPSINNIAIGSTVVLALVFGYLLFWAMPATVAMAIVHRGIGFNLLDGLIRLAVFFLYLAAVSRMPNVKRVFEYHGAEHKAINTLESNLALTVENARAASRIHPRCGTNFIFIVLITAIPVLALVPEHTYRDGAALVLLGHLYRLLLMPVVAGIAFEILKFAGTHRDKRWAMALIAPGLWTQYITTREPDDTQIEVALRSLQAVWDKEHQAPIDGAVVDTVGTVA
ncbi:MAG: DUF1385 domain-containing protein [Capsulimonadaceae bacterium]